MPDILNLGHTMVVVVGLAAFFILFIFFRFVPVGLWISAISAGVKVSIFSLIGIYFSTSIS